MNYVHSKLPKRPEPEPKMIYGIKTEKVQENKLITQLLISRIGNGLLREFFVQRKYRVFD